MNNIFKKKLNVIEIIELLFLVLISFFAAQRYLLPSIYSYICILPFLVFIYKYFNNKKDCILYLILSLFFSVDNGGELYIETSNYLRYIMYVSALLYISRDVSFHLRSINKFMLFVVVLVFITLLNHERLELGTFIRDGFILFIILHVMCNVIKEEKSWMYYLSDYKLVLSLLIYVIAEFINVMLFYEPEMGYINYDSLKSLIVFPSLYFLVKRRYILFISTVSITLYVTVFYVTRMIILSFLIAIMLYNLISIVKKLNFKNIFVFITLISICIFIPQIIGNYIDYEAYKATNLFVVLFSNVNVSETLKLLDPVRYTELVLFLDRNVVNLLLGSGLGVGIVDGNDLFNFVGKYDTAFSEIELNSNFFYNFHDIWIDIGLRFGLLFIFYIYLKLLKPMFKLGQRNDVNFISLMLLVLLFCAFFSTSGLIVISLFCLLFRYRLTKY